MSSGLKRMGAMKMAPMKVALPHSRTHALTRSMHYSHLSTHSILLHTHTLTHSLTHSLTHWLYKLPPHPIPKISPLNTLLFLPPHSLTHSLTHSLIQIATRSFSIPAAELTIDEKPMNHPEDQGVTFQETSIVPPGDAGTFAAPILVPSQHESRFVGYEDPDSHMIRWYVLTHSLTHSLTPLNHYWFIDLFSHLYTSI
jgi:hypothetical protein